MKLDLSLFFILFIDLFLFSYYLLWLYGGLASYRVPRRFHNGSPSCPCGIPSLLCTYHNCSYAVRNNSYPSEDMLWLYANCNESTPESFCDWNTFQWDLHHCLNLIYFPGKNLWSCSNFLQAKSLQEAGWQSFDFLSIATQLLANFAMAAHVVFHLISALLYSIVIASYLKKYIIINE